MKPITLTTPVRRSTSIIASELKNSTVMMDIEAGQYYELNPVAARIWQLLETETTPAAVCTRLMAEYEIGEAACETEVMAFLHSLNERAALDVLG